MTLPDLRLPLVLGLIAETPRHAYDVEQCIRDRHLREWTPIGFSSVYTVLSRLEEAGLAASQDAPGEAGRPRRRVYAPTDAGRAQLAEWTATLVRTPSPPQSSVTLGLMLSASALAPSAAATELDALASELERRIAATTARHEAIPAAWRHPVQDALFAHDLALLETERQWAQDTARTLRDSA